MAERTEIKKFDNFIIYREQCEINKSITDDLIVKPINLAEKHVVEVRLDHNSVEYDGAPVKYAYYKVYVSHGMRCKQDTLAETQEYINVLKEAIEVAFEVQKYAVLNGYWAK